MIKFKDVFHITPLKPHLIFLDAILYEIARNQSHKVF